MDKPHKNNDGIPIPVVGFIEGEGINEIEEFDTPISKQVTTLYVANYSSSSDHAGTYPAAVIQPYYRYRCLDRAYELIAEINVMVREWNTESAFNNWYTDPNNHDEGGAEDPPFSHWKNDFWDWKDYADGYPGTAG